jgi:hypothetical protein
MNRELTQRQAGDLARSSDKDKWNRINSDQRVFVFDGSTLVATCTDMDELKKRRLEWFNLKYPYIQTAQGQEVSLRTL